MKDPKRETPQEEGRNGGKVGERERETDNTRVDFTKLHGKTEPNLLTWTIMTSSWNDASNKDWQNFEYELFAII